MPEVFHEKDAACKVVAMKMATAIIMIFFIVFLFTLHTTLCRTQKHLKFRARNAKRNRSICTDRIEDPKACARLKGPIAIAFPTFTIPHIGINCDPSVIKRLKFNIASEFFSRQGIAFGENLRKSDRDWELIGNSNCTIIIVKGHDHVIGADHASSLNTDNIICANRI